MSAAEADGSKQAQLALRLTRAEMALEALFNVIHNNPGVEVQCLGHFKLLFSLLATEGASKLQLLALKAVSSVTGNRACVSNIADAGTLQYLLLVIYMLPACGYYMLCVCLCGWVCPLAMYWLANVHSPAHAHTHTAHELALEVFQALTSNTQIVKEAIQKGTLSWAL